MKSMTGYAKRQCEAGVCKYTIEIKTLNSKSLDAIVKLPASLHTHELELRQLLNMLERGKVDVLVTEETSTSAAHLNRELAGSRFMELKALSEQLGCGTDGLLARVAGMNDVWIAGEEHQEIDDEGWNKVAEAVRGTIEDVDTFRLHEGEVLHKDFDKHIALIREKLEAIPQYETERIDTAKERIHRYFADFAIKDVDQNRFEQELIYYLEKLDITEEKIRLAKHIDYFLNTVATEPSCGKKLGFVAQEMGREINTIGSKANHVAIQQLVVEMKDELEKIKEQLGNIL